MGKRYGMVVDLHKCTGCGACALACKTENNVQDGHFWCNYKTTLEGDFPNLRYTFMPTFCNHCDNAPCIPVCPVEPHKAIFKNKDGLTLMDAERCIGCQACQAACPYGVIFFNETDPHPFWDSDAGRDVTERTGAEHFPYYNPNRATTWNGLGVRKRGVVEKCSFCDHRLEVGKLPFCVERCPADALHFGDLDDPDSHVSRLLEEYPDARRLQEETGAEPRVYYIRQFNRPEPSA